MGLRKTPFQWVYVKRRSNGVYVKGRFNGGLRKTPFQCVYIKLVRTKGAEGKPFHGKELVKRRFMKSA
ncbi:MAG TPA: hypothetical protein VI603_07105 [Saprospiraceae bacterium]|nr:hypothetical protein [Saprospiraceae bacterium]